VFQVLLFVGLAALIGLFAFAAVRADQILVAAPAALLSVWLLDSARAAARRRRRDRAT
jgi:hypothetical protein